MTTLRQAAEQALEWIAAKPDDMSCHCTTEGVDGDPHAATRRAIVRAAAEIGRNTK